MATPAVKRFVSQFLTPEQASKLPPKSRAEARPSASVLLISHQNEILMLHRVGTSTSFALAHVFPGGNLDGFHEGNIPSIDSPERHVDGRAYRMGAIRECFEETGILLAKKDGKLVSLSVEERDAARKTIHKNEKSFPEWLESIGCVPDLAGLVPFTRWITPAGLKKRFTTQMYIYMLPMTRSAVPQEMLVPTPDGGVEHTAATFAPPQAFLDRAIAGKITLPAPQTFLLLLLSAILRMSSTMGIEEGAMHFGSQRKKLSSFIRRVPTATSSKGKAHPTAAIPWGEKVFSPYILAAGEPQRKAVLGLDSPGHELQGSGRGGDWDRVLVANLNDAGTQYFEMGDRQEMLAEISESKGKL